MNKKTIIIITVVCVGAAAAAAAGVLVWWLVAASRLYTTEVLGGDIYDVPSYAALTHIRGAGAMFWWLFPAERAPAARAPAPEPLLLWLDGLAGGPPSAVHNLLAVGPLDHNLKRRNHSWTEEYSLLFVDAPLGTGFSTAVSEDKLATTLDQITDHLVLTLESFFSVHGEYISRPLYLVGERHGAQLALALALRLATTQVPFSHNVRGVVLGNAIVSPARALTALGRYLEQWGYVEGAGRGALEGVAGELAALVGAGRLRDAADMFLGLQRDVDGGGGAGRLCLHNVAHKMAAGTDSDTSWGSCAVDVSEWCRFMQQEVSPALGGGVAAAEYDAGRLAATDAFRGALMAPKEHLVEEILQNTNLSVTIYNGNLDALSNTPGQLEWVEELQWDERAAWAGAPRTALVVGGVLQGHVRRGGRLAFYWLNAAGRQGAVDSPEAMRRIMQFVTNQ